MTEIERIRDLLYYTYQGGCWHGPGLKQNLDGVTAEQAASRPIGEGHSIWEIVRHVTAWINEVIQTLDGETYQTLPAEQDWPPLAADDIAAWESAKAILDSSMDALCSEVMELDESKLDENVPGQEFSYYWLLNGVVHHNTYHSGQIGILRKAFAQTASA
jgi:uncharacterized damage-inducible protein DinB